MIKLLMASQEFYYEIYFESFEVNYYMSITRFLKDLRSFSED